MMPTQDCLRARQALHVLLARGEEPAPGDVDHWRDCSACQALAAQLNEALEAELNPEPSGSAATVQALEAEVSRQSRRRLGLKQIAVFFLGAGFVALWAWLLKDPTSGWSWGIGAFLLVALVVPALLVGWVARLPRQYRLYKRLGKGRALSGVCLGLAERTGFPVWAWRTAFAAAGLLRPESVVFYAFLALLMPVHPEDRAGLFRFRIARFWRRIILRRAQA